MNTLIERITCSNSDCPYHGNTSSKLMKLTRSTLCMGCILDKGWKNSRTLDQIDEDRARGKMRIGLYH